MPWVHLEGSLGHRVGLGPPGVLARATSLVQHGGPLITADALLNLSHHPSRLTRAVALLMGNTAPGKGYLERVAVRDWTAGRRQVDRMLEWDVDRIALAHGGLVERDGREVLRQGYSWL